MKNGTSTLWDFFKSFLYISLLGLGVYLGCLYGYEQLNVNRTVFAVDRISENMHNVFLEPEDYPSAEVIKEHKIVPEDLIVTGAKEYFWRNYFGGNMLVYGAKSAKEPKYNIVFNNLSKRKCKLLANKDWRDNKYFVGVIAQGYGIIAKNAGDEFSKIERLIPEKVAEKLCDCGNKNICSVVLVYR